MLSGVYIEGKGPEGIHTLALGTMVTVHQVYCLTGSVSTVVSVVLHFNGSGIQLQV